MSSSSFRIFFYLVFCGLASGLTAQTFFLPTANTAIFEPDGGAERFYVGTVGRPWTAGQFGCVRSEGWQMHEGIDIRCVQRDEKSEPTDPVTSVADGTVAYLNRKAGLSNFGNYAVIRHNIEGLEVYSLYAHLRQITSDLEAGVAVKAGQPIGVMGRTSNTSQGISKERAHVHFELNLYINERFSDWHNQNMPGQRNDHGRWNGQNMVGLDPTEVFLTQQKQGAQFSLLNYVRNQKEMFRVVVRDTKFPWIQRYPVLIKRNAVAEQEGIAGFEIALNYNGVPYQLIPRAASEIKGKDRIQLLSVDEAEYRSHPCRKLVIKRGQMWQLTAIGTRLLDLLTY